jgi:hypothetical protein
MKIKSATHPILKVLCEHAVVLFRGGLGMDGNLRRKFFKNSLLAANDIVARLSPSTERWKIMESILQQILKEGYADD